MHLTLLVLGGTFFPPFLLLLLAVKTDEGLEYFSDKYDPSIYCLVQFLTKLNGIEHTNV